MSSNAFDLRTAINNSRNQIEQLNSALKLLIDPAAGKEPTHQANLAVLINQEQAFKEWTEKNPVAALGLSRAYLTPELKQQAFMDFLLERDVCRQGFLILRENFGSIPKALQALRLFAIDLAEDDPIKNVLFDLAANLEIAKRSPYLQGDVKMLPKRYLKPTAHVLNVPIQEAPALPLDATLEDRIKASSNASENLRAQIKMKHTSDLEWSINLRKQLLENNIAAARAEAEKEIAKRQQALAAAAMATTDALNDLPPDKLNAEITLPVKDEARPGRFKRALTTAGNVLRDWRAWVPQLFS